MLIVKIAYYIFIVGEIIIKNHPFPVPVTAQKVGCLILFSTFYQYLNNRAL